MQFDFLGYTFRARRARNQRSGNLFTSFSPAVSNSAQKGMIEKLRKLRLRRRVEMSPKILRKAESDDIGVAELLREIPQRYINLTLIAWARKKYKTLRYRKTKACQLMERLSKEKPELFAHWNAGPESAFA